MTKTALNPDGLTCRAGIIRWSTLPNRGGWYLSAVIRAATQTPNAFILGRLNGLSKPAALRSTIVALNVFTTDVRNYRDISETSGKV
jgi:hypothetical protein